MVELRIEEVTKRFGDLAAVDNVSATIPAGELFFLLGPSGCGKTTLLRLIAGFLEPDHGSLFFGSRRMDGVSAHLRNTGMVFQNYALWPHMNVFHNVAYGLDVRKVPGDEKARRVKDILGLVRMAGLESRYPGEMSGGQQQRVALARALVIEPDVVLLDEPLSNLDAKLRLEMRAEIRRIHQRSPRTFIYVTHDQKEALSMADRIAVMNAGRIVQVGTPEEVYTEPASLFCARFLGNANVLRGTLRSVAGREAIVDTPLGVLSARVGPVALSGGGIVAVAVRPELVHPAAPSEKNAFDARIASRMYLGEMVQYQLEAGGVEMGATALGAGLWTARPGDTVRVAFDPLAAVAFPDERVEDL